MTNNFRSNWIILPPKKSDLNNFIFVHKKIFLQYPSQDENELVNFVMKNYELKY